MNEAESVLWRIMEIEEGVTRAFTDHMERNTNIFNLFSTRPLSIIANEQPTASTDNTLLDLHNSS